MQQPIIVRRLATKYNNNSHYTNCNNIYAQQSETTASTTITTCNAQQRTRTEATASQPMNGGFRITGYPAAAGAATATSAASSTDTILSACNTLANGATMHNTNSGNTNKINNEIGSHQGNGASNNAFLMHYNPLRGSVESQQSQPQPHLQLKHLQLQREQRERALDLHISEYQPPTPTQFTTVAPPLCGNTAAPIALKGNNPFLNSPSPTDTTAAPEMAFGYATTTTTATTAALSASTNSLAGASNSSNYEMPEYAEPQRFRAHKQTRPHSIAVASMTASMLANSTTVASTTPTSGATSYSSSTNDLAYSTLRRTPKALPNSFVDYASRHQLQQEEQLRQQHANLQQQQQRLLQFTRQQQQLRNAGISSNSGTPTSGVNTTASAGTPTPATSVDKEALYAALFQQYRNSPTRAPHATLSNKLSGNAAHAPTATNNAVTSSAAPTTNYCPPVPLHRNQSMSSAGAQLQQQQTVGSVLLQQPIVPRRSHSTPRPLKAFNEQQQPQSPQQPLSPAVNGAQLNGGTAPRPRSLDRFNSDSKPAGLYQPPPIPIRRFPPGVTNTRQSQGSPQPDGGSATPKFSGKKSTSIDNIRNGLSATSATDVSMLANNSSVGMRHSITFHGRSQSGQINAEHNFNGDLTVANTTSTTLGTTNVINSGTWHKIDRPLSYAYGASAPDQAYLENQLRAYSEQLRTITESVRKYSEQAKLLSELKRQQQLAKTQQLQPTSGSNNSPTVGLNVVSQSLQLPSSQSSSNFSSNMISPEIVSKSLASLCSSTEAQTPSHQLRLFLDNIRSTMRTEYHQNIPEEMLKPITESKSPTNLQQQATSHQQHLPHTQPPTQPQSLMAYKRPNLDETLRNLPVQLATTTNTTNKVRDNELPTPSDQLRLFLDAIRSNKIPETDDKPKLVNSQTLDSFISKPLQMPDVTSGTPGAQLSGMPPTRRRPKSAIATTKLENEQGEHSMITSESFHQISDNLRLMSEDLKALSPSKVVVSNSASSGNLKISAATASSLSPSLTTELRVITSHSPLSTSPTNHPATHYAPLSRANVNSFGASSASYGAQTSTNSPSPSQSTHSQSTSATTTPSTAPLMTDFNAILDSFQEMADKYKSKGSYDYLRKCSDALRQHSQQLKLREQQQQQQQQQMANGGVGGYMGSDDSSSCSTTPGSIREAVQNLLMQPRNGFQILDDRMRLFIDIIDSQDRLSQVNRIEYDHL